MTLSKVSFSDILRNAYLLIWIILTLSRITLSKMTLLKVYEKIDILLEIDIKEICMFDVCEFSSSLDLQHENFQDCVCLEVVTS